MSEERLSAAEQQAMEREFCERTGASAERAKDFLSDNWDLELAVHNFFLVSCGSDDTANPVPLNTEQCPSDVEIIDDDDSDTDSQLPAGSSVSIKKKDKSKRASNSKFGTLQHLNQENSSDDDEDQAFYAGGSVHSGQQILGPGKNRNDIIADMFRSVRENGMIMNQEPESSSSSAFSGTGYKLGATPDDTTVVKDPKSEKNKKGPEQVVVLRLWQNGFSLDGGELRPYNDPSNAQFLEYVRRGEIPPELRRSSEVFLTMEDRRHEEFSKIASGPAKPFQGKGYMLGSPAPTVVESTAVPSLEPEDSELNRNKAQSSLNINENEPTTNIQFRLADGSRISGRFNLTHTIAHLREYIVTAVPAYQLQTFILLTTFPNKELTDFNQSIKDAGLMNALVVQRLQ